MDKLKQILTQEDTVLFIGSGISLWSGLPSWSGLIEELAKFVESVGANAELVRAEVGRGDLLQAASYGFDKLTKQQIGDFIRATCRYGVARPHDIHRKIVALRTRCFVTTNYDNLIEEALRQWQPDRFFRPPITNRHLTETAEIIHARAIDFVFKPHGDAADSDSIILTREQYRQLLPQGERQNALESLKILLASRPVVYLGFGLRDPDFLYVRDLLANTYKGGTRDHYAIMADLTEAETDYWRRNYGIHLVNYTTTINQNGTKEHTRLLDLLDSLSRPESTASAPSLNDTCNDACSPDQVLSLARHAARLSRAPKVIPEFEIRVHTELSTKRHSNFYQQSNKFDHYAVDKFLAEGPERAILVGLPGAGKSYALQQAAARLADKLHEICLSEPFDESSVVIPVLVDLKLYRGDLAKLVSQTLPVSLPFYEMNQRFRFKVLLDSFNEMPREYWETGTYEADFSRFADGVGWSSLIIGSRTNDGLDKLEFPAYYLDQIDDKVVSAEISQRKINISGRFEQEIRQLLQKPFYFQFIISGAVLLPPQAHPRDFYDSFFINIDNAFVERFGKAFEIEKALSLAAYDAINRGEEAYPLSDLLRVLRANIEATGFSNINAQDIANWLVSISVLIPHIGGRIAFVHQSITEYLAAKELARRYLITPQILKEKLTLTRWDQALFLSLSLLPDSQAEAFFNDIVNADFALALNAVRYLEVGRDDVVTKLLTKVPDRIEGFDQFETRIGWYIESLLPISEIHEPQLRSLLKIGSTVASAAVKRLIDLKGAEIKDEMLREMVEARSDYNYCVNGIARPLKPFAICEDIRKIALLANSISDEVTPDSNDDTALGFISGAAEFLTNINISSIKEEFVPIAKSTPISEIHARILCDILWGQHSTEALELAGDLLLRGINKAATAICFIVGFGKKERQLSWTSFTLEHLNRLITMMDDPKEDSWALKALKGLCSGRQDIAEIVKTMAMERSGIAKASLLYCAIQTEVSHVINALCELVNMSPEQRRQEPTHLLQQIDINWAGNEVLFVQLLKLREYDLALAIIDQVYTPGDCPLGRIEIGPIEWWLDWLKTESDPRSFSMLQDRISWLFTRCLTKEVRHAFVVEFNNSASKYRDVLSRSILLDQSDLTTDDFSEDAVSFLLADLSRGDLPPWRGHLLGKTSTEQFIVERLLPLVPNAKEPLLKNIRAVLRQAGSRHGRRYPGE
ncbi:SIR2 family protein [Undibacterium sp. Tian12W]|uniref:SIR2 family protein n=1 Tax=Undibacterium sp. Tian12W TaxID=3413054 RepID=UPI003BF09DCC